MCLHVNISLCKSNLRCIKTTPKLQRDGPSSLSNPNFDLLKKFWKSKFKSFNYCIRKKKETEEQAISSLFLSSQALSKNLKVFLTVLPSYLTSKACPGFMVLVPWKPRLSLFVLMLPSFWYWRPSLFIQYILDKEFICLFYMCLPFCYNVIAFDKYC